MDSLSIMVSLYKGIYTHLFPSLLDTESYMKGFSISVNYNPSDNRNFFSNLFVTRDDLSCPVHAFVHLSQQSFSPVTASLYSECIGVYIHDMPTYGLTTKTVFPSSSSHWPDYLNTTLLITAYNSRPAPVQLGPFISLSNSTGSHIVLRVDEYGSVRGVIYKAGIKVYGTLVETDIPFNTGDSYMTFTAQARLFGAYDVTINGRITPSGSWDTALVRVNVQFATSSSSFIAIRDHLYQSMNDIVNFTASRLHTTDTDLSSISSTVTDLHSSVDRLETIYQENEVEYLNAKQTYDETVNQKADTMNEFEDLISPYNISNQCMPCPSVCQFTGNQSICNELVNLPITQVLLNTTASNVTVRYSIDQAVQQCWNEPSCSRIRGVKWLDQSSLLLVPYTYDGIDCTTVCSTYTASELMYANVLRESSMGRYYSNDSTFVSDRSYTCSTSQQNNCPFEIISQPCQAISDECNRMRLMEIITQLSNNSNVHSEVLQHLNVISGQYNELTINEEIARADLYLKSQRMEFNRRLLLLTRDAYTDALKIQQIIQNTNSNLPSTLSDDIKLHNILMNRLNPANTVNLVSINFTADLSHSFTHTIALVVSYDLLSQAQRHVLTREVNMNQPMEFVYEYISNEIITHFLSNSNRRKRNVPISSLPLVERNCFLLNEFHNYLLHINSSLNSAWNDTQHAVANIQWQSNQLQVRYNTILTEASSLSQANQSVLIERETNYLNEGQHLLTQLSDTVINTSMIQWLTAIQLYHNYTQQIGDKQCYSFIDCLNIISYSLFTDLSSGSSTAVREYIGAIQDIILTIASNKHATISETLSRIGNIMNIINKLKQDHYWCSTAPTFTSQTPPQLPIEKGGNYSITCPSLSVSTPGLTYQWIKDNYTLPSATSNVLTLYEINEDSEGYYQCQVTSEPHTVLSLASHVFIYQSPLITYNTNRAWTYIGNERGITIECTATASPYTPSWSWWFTPSINEQYVLLTGHTNSALFIDKPTLSNKGWYYCNASTPYGTALSAPIELLVIAPTVAINRYQVQFSISGSVSSSTANDLKDSIRDTLEWLNISSVEEFTVQANRDHYSVWFYIATANISSLYIYNSTLDNVTAQYTIERWRLQESLQVIRDHYSVNGQTVLTDNEQYDIINSSFIVGDRQYVCPMGSQLHSNYILCGKYMVSLSLYIYILLYIIVPCPSGYYANGTSRVYRPYHNIAEWVPQCAACPIGYYQPMIGSTHCIPCQVLYSTGSEASTDIQQCIGKLILITIALIQF